MPLNSIKAVMFIIMASVLCLLLGCSHAVGSSTTTTSASTTTSRTSSTASSTTTVNSTSTSRTSTSTTTTTIPVGSRWVQALSAIPNYNSRMGAPAAQINGRVVVAGGMSWPNYYNDVIYTDNGTDWSQKTAAFTTSRDAMALVNYNGMLWMLGGLVNGNPTNEVWYSAEGLTWTKEAVSAGFPSIYFPSAVAFDEKMWVLGGYTSSVTNDVWYSTNGGVWTKEAQAAPFTGKQQMGCIVYPEEGGKIWLIGGAYYSGGTVYTNEVWSSSDGSHWTKSAQNPVLDAVESPVCFNFDGKMWAISGIGAYGYYSKVLSSTDGTAWNTVSSYFSGSFASIGWASGGKMWLVGDVPNPGSERSLWYSNP